MSVANLPPTPLSRPPYLEPVDKELFPVPQKAAQTIENAKEFLESDPPRAIECLEELLKQRDLSPSNRFDAHLGLAKAHLLYPNLVSCFTANSHLEQAIMLVSNSDSIEFAEWKKAEIFKYQALILAQEKKPQEAAAKFKEALNTCKYHLTAAIDYVKFLKRTPNPDGIYDDPLKICDDFLDNQPDSAPMLDIRIKIHYEAEQWRKALTDCQRFLKLKDTKIIYQLDVLDCAAECCLHLNMPSVACKYLTQACDLDPTPLRRVERSKKLLDIQLARAPTATLKFTAFDLDLIRSIEANPKEALLLFDSIFDQYQKDEERSLLCIYRAVACEQSTPDLALQNFEQALKFTDKREIEAFIHLRQAKIYMLRYELDDALKHFQAAWEADESIKVFETYIVFLKKVKKDFKSALELCEKMLAKGKISLVYYHKADILYSLREWEAVRNACAGFLGCVYPQDDLKLNILDFATVASRELKIDSDCTYYSLQALRLDKSPKLLERFQTLSKYTQTDLFLLLNAAEWQLLEGDPEIAVRFFDLVLEKTNLFQALIGRVKACIKINDPTHFPSVHANIEEILKLLASEKFASPDTLAEMKAETYLCLANLFLLEKNFKEAKKNFAKGWAVKKTVNLCESYATFLSSQGDFETSLKICSELQKTSPANSLWFQSVTHRLAKQWKESLEKLSSLISLYRRTSVPETIIHAAYEASLAIKAYKAAQVYLIRGEEGLFKNVIYMKNRLENERALIVDRHLQKLCKAKPIDIPYLSLLLETYREELPEHPRHHVNLLLTRSMLYEQEKAFGKAVEDYTTILKIYSAHPSVFEFKEISYAEKRLKKASEELAKWTIYRVKTLQREAQTCEKTGKLNEAKEKYEEILKVMDANGSLFLKSEREQISTFLHSLKNNGIL